MMKVGTGPRPLAALAKELEDGIAMLKAFRARSIRPRPFFGSAVTVLLVWDGEGVLM
jgi:hypothetical protein